MNSCISVWVSQLQSATPSGLPQDDSVVFCASAGQSSCDRNSGWFSGAPESSWPSSDSSWQYYYMLGTTTKLSMPFQVLGL